MRLLVVEPAQHPALVVPHGSLDLLHDAELVERVGVE